MTPEELKEANELSIEIEKLVKRLKSLESMKKISNDGYPITLDIRVPSGSDSVQINERDILREVFNLLIRITFDELNEKSAQFDRL